ncbi:hypothetical protein [Sandaracinus amylolyticus]|uniref:Uncharacterized protein n=1 Tax=Sandaracinus amylolyticus TaxID=927083 RepID=A0A0F6W3R5_9BACT|nr:hypothetical protein [Sandaracinus amylolyticus]AKF06687.1 hypothetical protein DB32_003836 [Sandaracinus amylolyticus]
MSEQLYRAYVESLQREFPGLRVISKRGHTMSIVIDRLLKIVTLGGQSAYLTRYTTVLGRTIYTPTEWEQRDPRERYVTMRHEAVHLRQSRRYGMLLMSVLYALPFFPLGLAYGRARIEWEAYAETFRAVAEVWGPARARSPEMRAHVLKQFTSPAYGWMWPFPKQVNRWIDEVLATLPEA